MLHSLEVFSKAFRLRRPTDSRHHFARFLRRSIIRLRLERALFRQFCLSLFLPQIHLAFAGAATEVLLVLR